MAVKPMPDATSLLEGALWSPLGPLASPRAKEPPRPLALELDRGTPYAPNRSECRLPGRSGFAAGEGDVGGSGWGKVPIVRGYPTWAGVEAIGTKLKLKGF